MSVDLVSATIATVWIIHERRRALKADFVVPDLTDAERFGQLRHVFDVEENPSNDYAAGWRLINQRLAGFNFDNDYLLWAGGDPLALTLVGAWLYTKGEHARWLRPSRRQVGGIRSKINYTYDPMMLYLDELEGDD